MQNRDFDSVSDAAIFYIGLGWDPLPAYSGTKVPSHGNGWEKLRGTDDDAVERFSEGAMLNIGLVTGITCVDVDLDTANSRRYAKYFLPDTLKVTKSGEVTHYLYDIPKGHPPIETVQFEMTGNKMSCEVRGVAPNGNPQFTMVGPSIHPDGPKIGITEGQPKAVVSGEDLAKKVRLIAVCDLVTPYWESGGARHNLSLGLTGFLLKNGYAGADCNDVITAITEVCNDPDDRLAQIAATLRKYENGGKIAGENLLKDYLPEEAFLKLKSWFGVQDVKMEDFDLDEILAVPFDQRLPYLTYVREAEVFTTDGDPIKAQQLHDTFSASKKEINNARDNCKRVRGFGYFPNKSLIVNNGVDKFWNHWRGTGLIPKEGDVEKFIEHVKSLCDNEPESYETLLKFAAHAVQKPEQKVRWMPILIGGQGSGKSTFCDILGRLVGSHNYSAISAQDLLTGWSSLIENRVLIAIEEMRISHSSQTKALANVLKEKVTNDTITISKKYINEYQVDNVARFIGLSNHLVPIEIERTDRRYFVVRSKTAVPNSGLTVHDARKGWIDGYHNWLYNEGGIEAILHYLMNLDISDFNPDMAPEASEEQAMHKKIIHHTTSAPVLTEEVTDLIDALLDENPVGIIEAREFRKRFLEDNSSTITAQKVNACCDYLGIRRESVIGKKGGKTRRYSFIVLDKELNNKSPSELVDRYLGSEEAEENTGF